jgi:hypothetical protein
MNEIDYERARNAAQEAEIRYLDGMKRHMAPEGLTGLATCAQDRWTAVATLCALAEDAARSTIEMPPIRHRHEVLTNAWRDVRNWAVLGENAAARSALCGAMADVHRPEYRAREVIRLYAEEILDEVMVRR